MRPADFLTVHYDPGLVALSLLIAVMAGYVALDLSRRVGPLQRASRRWFWSAAGSLALGCGIWSMHFVGMLAYSLPIDLGYDKWLTFLSWLEAVGVSAVAFTVLDGGALGRVRHLAGSAIMGAGIAAMHYTGMAAIDVAPGIVWDPWLVAASITIAVVASGAALALSFWLKKISPQPRWWSQGLTAIVIGLAISGMHYTGMAAASFRSNAICGSSGSLSGSYLVTLVGSAALSLLFLTLVSSAFDARAQRSADRLTESLGKANDRLHSANAELLRRALSDPLTNLPNRHHFEDRLEQALQRQEHAQEAKGSGRLAVLFIDLDGFKSVNDTLGHAAGDSVLVRAAHRLQAAARGSDTVARVGGDEFLLLMEDLSDPADAVRMATRLLQSLAEPQEVADRRVEISGSIGIVIHPDQGQRDKLIANADSAMYAAKRAGGNTCAVFEASMEADASRQLGLHSELRHAAERGELRLYYQPKIECRRGQFVGVEALLRWLHPVRGMVGPVEFIPLAERFGLIGSMGQWVIEEACRQMAEWAEDGVRMRVAINLSVHQLREPDLAGRIGAALERHGVASSQLLCEITESVAMEDIAATLKAFDDLASIGVFISIDDFGTGHSSLSYLRKLPARQLKIDRSFISDLETSQDARAVVDAVIRLAHALSLEVVAEGVETEGQRRVLDELGCDQLQGYLFAKPMPAEVLRAWAIGQKPTGSSVDFTPSVMHAEG